MMGDVEIEIDTERERERERERGNRNASLSVHNVGKERKVEVRRGKWREEQESGGKKRKEEKRREKKEKGQLTTPRESLRIASMACLSSSAYPAKACKSLILWLSKFAPYKL